MLNALRRFFDDRDFFEVQTPVLSHDVLVDRYVEPIAVPFVDEIFYLQTSPEFAMKRLLASGCERIYQIAPAFRSGDRGPLHNVEFTLLEWYRVGDGYEEGIHFLKDLADTFLTGESSTADRKTDRKQKGGKARGKEEKRNQTAGGTTSAPSRKDEAARGTGVNGKGGTLRSFASVFEEKTGVCPHGASADLLRRLADRLAPDYPKSFLSSPLAATADDWLDYLFAELVQPSLGTESPVIVFDYPVSQSQLAKIGPPLDAGSGAENVTRRFELFSKGTELANGYDELTDPSCLRSRFQETARFRKERRCPTLPTESRLLAAMDAGLPPSSGCALGVDRLLMIRLGIESIDEVIPFPIEEA